MDYPSDNGQLEIEKSESRGNDPNVDDGNGSKDHSPHDGDGHCHHGRHYLVEPGLGLAEDHKGQSPDPVKTLSGAGLGQNIVEIELYKK